MVGKSSGLCTPVELCLSTHGVNMGAVVWLFPSRASHFPLNFTSRNHLSPLGSSALRLQGFSTKEYFYSYLQRGNVHNDNDPKGAGMS